MYLRVYVYVLILLSFVYFFYIGKVLEKVSIREDKKSNDSCLVAKIPTFAS